ncbi:MAG: GNAT family protein [Bacteroidota bacterium]
MWTTADIEHLIERFERQALPAVEWTHEAHLVVGFSLIDRFDFPQAFEAARKFIRLHNTSVGTPNTDTEGYHDTITGFWLHLIEAFSTAHQHLPLPARINRFLCSSLSRPTMPLAYYEHRVLYAVKARQQWVEPQVPFQFDFGYRLHQPEVPERMETERLRIEKIAAADADDLAQLLMREKDRFIMHFTPEYRALHALNGLPEMIRNCHHNWAQRTAFYWGLYKKGSSGIIGKLELSGLRWEIPCGYLSYYIASEHEGQGLVNEAVSALINVCFNGLGFTKLELRTSDDNLASHRIAEKNGFVREGVVSRNYRRFSGELVDIVVWGLKRENWITT